MPERKLVLRWARGSAHWPSPAVLLGFVAVAAVRLLTLPHSVWEGDEVLFIKGIEHFDPLHHQPHPPGYPLLIGLGKLLHFVVSSPFAGLVALSVLSSLVGYAALVDAFHGIVSPATGRPAAERIGVAGALLFQLAPPMLIYGVMALSDPPALMFLALALAAAVRLADQPVPSAWPAACLGAFASAAIGCRPQLAVAVLPMLLVALWPARRNVRQILAALGAFIAVSLSWFLPLLSAVGEPAGLTAMLGRQAGLVATYDAAAPRTGGTWIRILTRFVFHPWGTRWTSLPVLALAAVGALALTFSNQTPPTPSRARVLPLVVLGVVNLVFCVLVMNPEDAVRYALPTLLGVAFAAAVGIHVAARRIGMPSAVWPVSALLAAGFIFYTAPLLWARTTTDSPPVQAARWIERSVPLGKVLIVEAELAPHASYLLRQYLRIPADPALQREPEHLLTRPDWILGDGESTWPDARTFAWPDSDPFGKMTRGHLRVVSVSPIPPDRWSTPVRGVYAFEPSIRQPLWRWLAPDAVLRLDLRLAPARLAVVTLSLPPHAPLESVTVTIGVNDTPLAVVTVPRSGRQVIVLPLPGGAANADISFHSRQSFVPAAAGLGPDVRRLAVQLVALERQGR